MPTRSYQYLREYGYHLINPNTILQTDLRYCHIGDYVNNSIRNINDISKTFCSIVSYLSAYVEYPNMEMAARLGIKGAIDDLILHGKKNVHGLNWKADNIQDFLKLETRRNHLLQRPVIAKPAIQKASSMKESE